MDGSVHKWDSWLYSSLGHSGRPAERAAKGEVGGVHNRRTELYIRARWTYSVS